MSDRCPCGIFDENCEHCEHRDEEIERLRAERDNMKILFEASADRLERLEEELDDKVLGKVLIPREKIRKAWLKAVHAGGEFGKGERWLCASDLGIVECHECGGSRRIEDEWEVNGPVMIDCPRCDGEGWVIEEATDE